MKKSTTHNLTVAAMLSAVAFILMFIEFPIPMLIPSFVKMDFSDLPALLGAFALGPVYGVVISFMKNLLHIVIKGTSTACVGELCNFMLGAVFSAAAGVIYKHHKSRKTAIIGAIAGAASHWLCSAYRPTTSFTYPAYVQFYHMPLEAILGMYQAILPSADSLIKCLVIFNMPFTLVKGLLDAVLCMLIYKPLSPILHGRSNLFSIFLFSNRITTAKLPGQVPQCGSRRGAVFRGKYIRQRSIRLMPLCPAICRVPAAQGTAHRAWSAQSSWPSIRPPAQNAEPAGKPA